jgi:NAD(P)H dehydrogenase (quinone)
MAFYAITGISGHVGGPAAEKLLADGHRLRAVVRSEAKAAVWRTRGAEIALAALDDADALSRAFAGVDGAFLMTPTWFEADDMFAENRKALAALGKAIASAGPAKLVLLSSIGAHLPRGTGAILKLHEMEEAFAGLQATASVRAAWFMENFTGMLPYVKESGLFPSMLAPLERAHPMVATADIGAVVACLLTEDWRGRRVIELEGPHRYAPRDVAAAFAAVLGRKVEARVQPQSEWDATYRSWGLTPRSAEAMAEMVQGFNSGLIRFEGNGAERATGGTTLETVLAGSAAG